MAGPVSTSRGPPPSSARSSSGLPPRPRPRPPPRVLVIGSGLAGLTTAYLLRREGCEVFIVEKSDRLGFHSSSVDVPLQEGQGAESSKGGDERDGRKGWVVDVPMRSFQGGYYPLLIALYRHLGLRLCPVDYQFSFSHLQPPYSGCSSSSTATTRRHTSGQCPPHASPAPLPAASTSTYFIHSGASGFSLPSLPSTSYRSFRTFLRGIGIWLAYAACYLFLLILAFVSWHSLLPLPENLCSLLLWTRRLPWPLVEVSRTFEEFTMGIVVPLFSAVGTMTSRDVLETPLETILEYVHSTLGTRHYTLGENTAGDVARLLAEPIEAQGWGHVRLGATIVSMKQSSPGRGARKGSTTRGDAEGSEICVQLKDGDEIVVDELVIATQATSALALLDILDGPDLSAAEQDRLVSLQAVLSQVKYRETIVVTHRDRSVLPPLKDIRDINLLTPLIEPRTDSQLDPTSGSSTPPLSPAESSTSRSSSSSPTESGPRTPVDGYNHQLEIPYFRPDLDSRHRGVYTMGTHVVMPPKRSRGQGTVLQTTNPVVPIAADSVLGIARLERALPLEDPSAVIAGLRSATGSSSRSRIHIVGSYAYPGIPLLEGCIGSAIRATEEILSRACTDEVEKEAEIIASTKRGTGLGRIDWSAGQGGPVGRLWRWRRSRSELGTISVKARS